MVGVDERPIQPERHSAVRHFSVFLSEDRRRKGLDDRPSRAMHRVWQGVAGGRDGAEFRADGTSVLKDSSAASVEDPGKSGTPAGPGASPSDQEFAPRPIPR
jgi:hypothetical protein